jgi:hypothetical protein
VNVFAETNYVYKFGTPHIQGRLRWLEASNNDGEISIPRKSHRTIHFATVIPREDSFIVHRMNGDGTYPSGDGKYTFPVHIQGKMLFLRKEISKVKLDCPIEVVIKYSGKDNITIDIKR